MQEFAKEKFCEILELIFDSQVVKKNRKNWCRTGFYLLTRKTSWLEDKLNWIYCKYLFILLEHVGK